MLANNKANKTNLRIFKFGIHSFIQQIFINCKSFARYGEQDNTCSVLIGFTI